MTGVAPGGKSEQAKTGQRRMARGEREHLEQTTLFEWIDYMGKTDDRFQGIFAIPNGGERHAFVAAKLKAEGVRAGVPDIFVPWPQVIGHAQVSFGTFPSPVYPVVMYNGLFIEMKIKPNTVKPHQREWLERLHKAGYMTTVCWSFDEAQKTIAEYLGVKL